MKNRQALHVSSAVVLLTGPCMNTSQTKCTLVATCFHAGFLLVLFFDPEDRGDMFLQKTFSRLHGFIPHNMKLFKMPSLVYNPNNHTNNTKYLQCVNMNQYKELAVQPTVNMQT
jgi:hypothetical protein